MIDDLLSRQTTLSEVGEVGQEVLRRAQVKLSPSRAADVAVEYLRRAGLGSVELSEQATPIEFEHARYFTHEMCEDFAHGSWLATRTIVELLEIDPRHRG